MHLLITGGAGFIGSHLVRHALDAGHEVTVLDNLSTGYRENIEGLPIRMLEGSVTEQSDIERATQEVDSIVHLAALGSVPRSIKDPLNTHHHNITGTLMVLESARRANVKRVIVASSSSVYGANPALPKGEREWVRPLSPYAVSKLATEQYTLAYQQSFGLETLAFRFFNVFGPRQRAGHAYAAVIPAFIDAIYRGEPIPINGDGRQSRDFTYVETVCRVIMDAIDRGVSAPEPVNLAFGTNTSLLDLLQHLERIFGRSLEVKFRPERPGDVKHSQADNTRLRELFPDISPTPLTEGLTATVDWFGKLYE